jgi:hypothetical protein
MRKIDFEKPFSEEDVTWLRQSAVLSEEAIARHQAQFDAKVPKVEETKDTVTQSALDPQARLRGEFVGSESAAINISPDLGVQAGDAIVEESENDDDYDAWKVRELEAEVEARNKLAEDRDDVTMVEVTGTGTGGAVRKPDLIKGLRIWDDENPGVLDEEPVEN